MTLTELQRRAKQLGYTLGKPRAHAAADNWDSTAYVKRFHPRAAYYTAPMHCGPWNYFQTLAEIERYLGQVEQMRAWQS